jgi:N-formylglutamate deformylase
VLRRVESFLVQRRYVVRRNDPYAGGYITRHYGRPSADCHALQIEVARGLYMDEANLTKSSGFGRVEADLRALAEMLSEELPALLERDRGWSGGDAA